MRTEKHFLISLILKRSSENKNLSGSPIKVSGGRGHVLSSWVSGPCGGQHRWGFWERSTFLGLGQCGSRRLSSPGYTKNPSTLWENVQVVSRPFLCYSCPQSVRSASSIDLLKMQTLRTTSDLFKQKLGEGVGSAFCILASSSDNSNAHRSLRTNALQDPVTHSGSNIRKFYNSVFKVSKY